MLISQGIELVSDFITHENCRQLLQEIELYQSIHAIPTIHRDRPGRSLRYQASKFHGNPGSPLVAAGIAV